MPFRSSTAHFHLHPLPASDEAWDYYLPSHIRATQLGTLITPSRIEAPIPTTPTRNSMRNFVIKQHRALGKVESRDLGACIIFFEQISIGFYEFRCAGV